MNRCFIGIDLGGTKTIVASSDESGKILKQTRAPTPVNVKDGQDLIEEMIKNVVQGEIASIGCACGGPLDWKKGTVSPVHMPQWKNINLKNFMEKKFSCNFCVDVDTNVAALGEYYFGNAKKYRSFVYITLSTGMGAALLIDGKIYRGKDGGHPEMGHQSINHRIKYAKNVPFCDCGIPDCLEGLVSGTSIKRLYGKNAENVNEKNIIEEIGYNFGQGLRNITMLHAPDAIVVGGGVAHGFGERLLSTARDVVNKHVTIVPKPVIELSSLGCNSSLMGSIAVAIHGVD